MQGVGRHQIGHARRDRQRARLWPDGGRDDDPERGRRRLRRMARVSRRWLITGVSGGLGRALAEAALARGDSVAGTLREGAADFEALAPGRAHAMLLDLSRLSDIPAAIEAAAARLGGIDVQIGRAHVWTPVTNAHLVCRLLLEKKKHKHTPNNSLTSKFNDQHHRSTAMHRPTNTEHQFK